MSDRAKRSAERIRKEIPMVQVLFDLGYHVDPRGGTREQQFSCDFHGDGRDSTASARVFPSQYFCWACGRSRDAITLLREKKGLKFWDAIRALEAQYGLPPLPWEAGDDERRPTLSQVLEEVLHPSETAEQVLSRVDAFLMGICRERSLDPHKVASLWEAYDRVVLFASSGGDSETVRGLAHKVLTASKEAVRKANQPLGA